MPQGQSPDANQASKSSKKALILILVGVGVAAILITILAVIFVSSLGNEENPAPPTQEEQVAPSEPSSGSDSIEPSSGSSETEDSSGDTIIKVGKTYKTRWFSFTIESLDTDTKYGSHTAASGNTLVIAHITLTNTSGSSQPFGTFDWLVDDDSLTDYIFPLSPLNDKMMPEEFDLEDGKTVSYDVVIEYSADLKNPYFMYIEEDEYGARYSSYKYSLK